MLQTYTRSNNGTAVASSTPINFLLNKIKRSYSVQHQEGSPSIVLRGAGVYKIEFNGIFTAPSTEATTINVQMLSDNTVVPEALAVATSTSTTDYVNLAFTTLVRVKPSCCTVDNTTTLTFLNTNADILFNANVVVTKIC